MKFLNTNKFFNRYLPLGLSVILLVAAGFFWQVYTARASYTYTRSITLQSSQIPANQSNFTVLICANFTMGNGNACPTVAGLNQTGGGAHVQNSSGYDITFWTSSNCTGAMNWEMENYTPSTGEMEAWVLITSLSTSGNTIYMCYGNSGISSFQGGASSGVWDTNYIGVWHLAASGGHVSYADSTLHGNTGTDDGNSSSTPTTGQIDGAAHFPADSKADFPTMSFSGGETVSAWVNLSNFGSFGRGNIFNATGGYGGISVNSTDYHLYLYNNTSQVGKTVLSTNTTYYLTTVCASNGDMHVYVNGVNDDAGPVNYAPACTATTTFRIGSRDVSSWNAVGMVDEVRLSGIGRSADWITTEYNSQSAPGTFETFGSETSNSTGGFYSRVSIQNMRASIQNARVSVTGN